MLDFLRGKKQINRVGISISDQFLKMKNGAVMNSYNVYMSLDIAEEFRKIKTHKMKIPLIYLHQ